MISDLAIITYWFPHFLPCHRAALATEFRRIATEAQASPQVTAAVLDAWEAADRAGKLLPQLRAMLPAADAVAVLRQLRSGELRAASVAAAERQSLGELVGLVESFPEGNKNRLPSQACNSKL